MKCHKKRISFLTLSIIIIVAFVLLTSIFFITVANPIVAGYSVTYIDAISKQALNDAILETLNDENLYSKIINIEKNENGDVAYMEADYLQINKIVRSITSISQKKVAEMTISGFALPLGTFTGVSFLTGKGPNVKLKVVPIGAVGSNLYSNFTSTGVNSTLHRIYAEIDVHVNVILPIQQREVKSKNKVLLCESVIIGKVPNVYLNSNSLNEMLHLVP